MADDAGAHWHADRVVIRSPGSLEPGLRGPTPIGRVLYGLGYFFFRTIFTVVWRLKILGRENVPRSGGLLFAANHTSWADPPMVGCSLPRPIYFMAKQELFDAPLFGWVFRQVNAFPIKRVERDVSAFKTAQRILAAGGALIVFPEGTRQRTGQFGPVKAGVGMLSVKTGCPVVPVYVHNAHKLGRFARVTVCLGKPVRPSGETDYQAYSQRIMREIAALKEQYFGPSN
jgi:1-acyl-sn-glycerol-3-phosphate acyltransferase